MGIKISQITAIAKDSAETGLEFEIEQEGISYKISLAVLIEVLNNYFMTLANMPSLMPKSGGTFTGDVVAKDGNPTTAFLTRNIKATSVDPGAGSSLPTGQILLVYED